MKKVLIALFLYVSINSLLSAKTYYISTTGSDSGTGTIGDPWHTWGKAISTVAAGDIVYIRGGAYFPNATWKTKASGRNGTADSHIKIMNYPGEKPVLDGSNIVEGSDWNFAIYLENCNYWDFEGLEVRYFDEPSYPSIARGFDLKACRNITFTNCSVHDTGGEGFSVREASTGTITFTNCDAYNNADTNYSGNAADGFDFAFNNSTVNFSLVGCRAWNNSDDGFDFNGSVGIINVDSCWAGRNGSGEGLGNGFKLGIGGTETPSGVEGYSKLTARNCISYSNGVCAFASNAAKVMMFELYNCLAYENVIAYALNTGTEPMIIRNSIAYSSGHNYFNEFVTEDHNTWNGGVTVSDADFVNLNIAQLEKDRKANGSLPDITFMHLAGGSDLIDAGVNVGISYSGSAPDLGVFELQTDPVNPELPVFVSSVIENATPSRLEMTYNLSLSNIIPAASSFTVMVSSTARAVSSVTISGTRVILTLASPVVAGNTVTVAYTMPATNPLQTAEGGKAATISARSVQNKVDVINVAPVIVVESPKSSYSGFVNEISASGSYDANKDNLTYSWSASVNMPLSTTSGATLKFLGPIVNDPIKVEFTVRVSDGKLTKSKIVPVEVLPYKPELDVAEISSIEASSFQAPFYPSNINDGNIGTMWSANGENQWLIIELKQLFAVQHLKIAFQPGQKRESYFDILCSTDKLVWEPILTKSVSCSFTGDLQVFEYPLSKTEKDWKYIKLVGRGNLTDAWNYISELKIFGYKQQNDIKYEELPVKIYPNPAKEYLTIRIDESTLKIGFVQITELNGKVIVFNKVDPELREYTIPVNLKNGFYIVQLGSANLILNAQKLIICK